MYRYGLVLAISIIFTAIATVMWGLAIAWSAGHKCATAIPLDRSGALAATALAGTWWAAWVLQWHNHDKSVLIRTLAVVVPAQRRELAKTRPMRRVR